MFMNKWLLLLFLSISIQTFSQTYTNIVFEGAGIRGIAYSGTIQALEEQNRIKDLKRVGGTSAGAITAVLLSVGYNAQEIASIIGSTKFAKFNDGGIPFFGGIYRLRKKFGWYKGKKFENWLGKLIANKTNNAEINFSQLAAQYKALYVTGTCLNLQKPIIFSAETYPNMPAKTAVRISMSVPLYYGAVLMDDTGKVYTRMPKNRQLNVMVDGGFFMNFPIRMFDSTKYDALLDSNFMAINYNTIGCRIDSKSQITIDTSVNRGTIAAKPVKNLSQYMNALLTLVTEQMNRPQLLSEDWQRSISISDEGIGPKVRGMPKKEIDALVKSGYQSTIKFLKKP